jgi:hypothetical protein
MVRRYPRERQEQQKLALTHIDHFAAPPALVELSFSASLN